MAYQAIENYGLIGNMRTVALVSVDGSIDWLCLPRFDSPSVFGRILDDKKGGHFRICPALQDVVCKQTYWPDTNVLLTRFLSAQGAAELADFMPVPESDHATARQQLVRKVQAMRGRVTLTMECRPAFDYARARHSLERIPDGVLIRGPGLNLALLASVPLEIAGDGVRAEFTLNESQSASFVLRQLADGDEDRASLDSGHTEILFRRTVDYWRAWLSRCRYNGRWREMVHRSALALKLLTYQPTGAIVAAPTCSLPEGIGGERNWDYRYTWIRDSAFTIHSLLRLGFSEEASAFMKFLAGVCSRCGSNGDSPLQIMYGIDGREDLTEEVLDHLDGYRGSRPVRIGNGAYRQLQLDIYGELIDAAYIYDKRGEPISYDLWQSLQGFVDWVCQNWRTQDAGVWEVRGGMRQFVHSKLMCWVAVDRGVRLAIRRSFPADVGRWIKVRDEIFLDLMANGWSENHKAFVQSYGSDALDASNLLMPLMQFVAPNDPRMLGTLDRILEPSDRGGLTSGSLVYRYNVAQTDDGLRGEEGTFNICTFWLVEALARAGRYDKRRLEEARIIFERMLGFANHLGLYAEETGARGEGLGNYPQAFTHLALISAAMDLDRALGPC